MPVEYRQSFAFLVLAFNHQDYIIEHLESVKYLVLTHGNDMDVDVIINDDCSKDNTRSLVDKWLQLNRSLFRHATKIYNPTNLGTCASVNNMLSHVVADRCKLTAGDDVYSYENIFELTQYDSTVAMVSGRALHLINGTLGLDRIADALAISSQMIYKNYDLLTRFKHLSYSNAPNILYATECLMSPNVRNYLSRFDVVEDWSMQIAIARNHPERKFKLLGEVLVYYRRTEGSTYIVANNRFVADKLQLFDDLIINEGRWLEKLRLQMRKYCFGISGKYMKKILNIDIYFFVVSFIKNALNIRSYSKEFPVNVVKHRLHYESIKSIASKVDGCRIV